MCRVIFSPTSRRCWATRRKHCNCSKKPTTNEAFAPAPEVLVDRKLTRDWIPFAVIRVSRRSSRKSSARNHEQLLFRAKAAQCLQSCGRLRGGGVAADSGGIDFPSGVQRAAMGDANCHPHSCCWVPGCAGFFLG